jgi:cytochrome c peroxidase
MMLRGLLIVAAAASCVFAEDPAGQPWTAAQREVLNSLWLGSLPPLPASPDNPVADDVRAARLGRRLFFDPRLSADGRVSCATCHDPQRDFLDGKVRSQGLGFSDRRAMTVVASAYSPWLLWDGRKDSLWAQALAPLENAAEQGGTRARHVGTVLDDAALRAEYQQVFGPVPQGVARGDAAAVTKVFINLGKAIEAFERRIRWSPAAFDTYVEALRSGRNSAAQQAMTSDQISGLRLFIGKASCLNCHSGPLFTNHDFHNIGLTPADELSKDRGRIDGVKRVLADEFRCGGAHSRATLEDCRHVKFVQRSGVELVGAFKTPSLRNVAQHSPYMHDGRFKTLREVLEHYNLAAPTLLGHELLPLDLSVKELAQLEAFLHALSAPFRIDLTEN